MLERIAELVIPPAWKDVWICPNPNGHIQATGFDAAGRKQYLYHPRWRESRDREKFDGMTAFAKSLPAMREQVIADLELRGLVRDRVLACSVRLLDLGFFRIGSERYAAENETFGLATLRKKHVHVARGHAVFDYKAKHALRHRQEIADPHVVPVVKALKNRKGGGHELLAFRDGRGWIDVKAADINIYLKAVMGGDYTAKDFRTWNATVLAAVQLATDPAVEAKSKTARKRAAAGACKTVASYLSNTPAVCRSAYIDPRVFDRYDAGETIRGSLERIVRGTDPGEFPDRERIEAAVLRLLAD